MTQRNKKTMTPKLPDPEAERSRLIETLTKHHTWIFRAFGAIRAWEYLVPWPLGCVHFFLLRLRGNKLPFKDWLKSRDRVDDNGWLSFAIVTWLYLAVVVDVRLDRVQAVYASDCAKILFSGAFLIGTVLSVSVAMPGQALAKVALGRDSSFALNFVLPLFWGFLWGIAGALSMMFFPGVPYLIPNLPECSRLVLRDVATFIAIHGAVAELNAIVHTVRMYLMGMLLWSKELDEKARAEEAEKRSRNP
jgi:hypothetical protein